MFRYPAIVTLNISASKFEDLSENSSTPSISSFFNKKSKTDALTVTSVEKENTQDHGEEDFSSLHLVEKETVNSDSKFPNNSKATSSIITPIISLQNRGESLKGGSSDNAACGSKLNETHTPKKKGIEAFFSGSGAKTCDVKDRSGGRTRRNPYQDCEIDSSVLESLPDDIRREIHQSLSVKNEPGKRAKEGGDFFDVHASSTEKRTRSEDNGNMAVTCNTGSDNVFDAKMQVFGSNRTGNCTDLVKCEKCGESLSHSEMPEHSDYHFALELQQGERTSSAARNTQLLVSEPPKKKQRTTIQSFFSPK